jgi:hypothetical protein
MYKKEKLSMFNPRDICLVFIYLKLKSFIFKNNKTIYMHNSMKTKIWLCLISQTTLSHIRWEFEPKKSKH